MITSPPRNPPGESYKPIAFFPLLSVNDLFADISSSRTKKIRK